MSAGEKLSPETAAKRMSSDPSMAASRKKGSSSRRLSEALAPTLPTILDESVEPREGTLKEEPVRVL